MLIRYFRHFVGFVFVLSLLFWGTACQALSGKITVTVSPLQTPDSTLRSPVATAIPKEEMLAGSLYMPKPEDGKGAVVCVLQDLTFEKPYAFQFVYLAKVIEFEKQGEGEPLLFAELNVQTAPFAQTDERGRLVIENVEPGRYALAVRLPSLTETLLYNAYTQANLYVDVKPSEVSDMGTIEIVGPH